MKASYLDSKIDGLANKHKLRPITRPLVTEAGNCIVLPLPASVDKKASYINGLRVGQRRLSANEDADKK